MEQKYSEIMKVEDLLIRYNYTDALLEIVVTGYLTYDTFTDNIIIENFSEPVVVFAMGLRLESWELSPEYYADQLILFYKEEQEYKEECESESID